MPLVEGQDRMGILEMNPELVHETGEHKYFPAASNKMLGHFGLPVLKRISVHPKHQR
jgi:hypothetical protein